ncbi:MAG: ATP-binding protein [Planctomycetes bacterium]|nr:ATP-binding protein [Planctomycetota bacterium]
MLKRRAASRLITLLGSHPVVALVGPRQVGKTTLARAVGDELARACSYLDLERPSDRAKLGDAELYLGRQARKLTVLDEVQCMPELFPVLRGLVDERIRAGEKAGQFLVLGSASPELIRQSSESLAGRIAWLELAPFTLDEVERPRRRTDIDRLWWRGGFPDSFLAHDDATSLGWREQFVRAYLERDLPALGLKLPAARVGRFWEMLAHGQGDQLNAARLASGLGVSGNTIRHYLDLLTDLFLVRQLPTWSGNSQKRLVKAPRVFVRDSGLVHALARIPDADALLGHPLCGPSWEGFVIEQTLAWLPATWRASYYRSAAQAELDLVLEGPKRQVLAIEIKRTLSPSLSKGFVNAFADVGATHGYVVMPAGGRFPLRTDVEALSLRDWIAELPDLFGS